MRCPSLLPAGVVFVLLASGIALGACTKSDTTPEPSPTEPSTGVDSGDSTGTSGSIPSGSSGSSGTAPTDSGPLADAGSDTAPVDSGCNALADQGAVVAQVVAHAPAPTASGGAIVDGTYVLTASKYHTSSFTDGQALNTVGSITLEVQGTALRVVFTDDGGAVDRVTGTVAATGTSFALTATCGAAGPYFGGLAGTTYSATATSLTLLMPSPISASATLENVFTKK